MNSQPDSLHSELSSIPDSRQIKLVFEFIRLKKTRGMDKGKSNEKTPGRVGDPGVFFAKFKAGSVLLSQKANQLVPLARRA